MYLVRWFIVEQGLEPLSKQHLPAMASASKTRAKRVVGKELQANNLPQQINTVSYMAGQWLKSVINESFTIFD